MQLEKMQQALFMIAEIRDSVRLREFARTSKDREWCFCFCFLGLEFGFPYFRHILPPSSLSLSCH